MYLRVQKLSLSIRGLRRLVGLYRCIDPKDAYTATVETAKAVADKSIEAQSKKLDKERTPSTDSESSAGIVAEVTTVAKIPPKVVTFPPPSIEEPFAPSIEGLEEARLRCRFMMSRIIQEVRCHKLACKFHPC